MSTLTNQVIIKCKRCRRPVKVDALQTTNPDADLTQLHALLKMLEENALCPRCQAGLNFYARQGRGADWQAGRP